jgi:cytochrome c oxidase subunit III
VNGAVVVRGVLDVSALRVDRSGREAPIYWGMWGLILIEVAVFASLISSYLYLRLNAIEWPPGGVDPPEVLLPTINTGLLLISIYFVHVADRAVRAARNRALVLALTASTVLAIVFLVIKAVEYGHLGFRWDSHAYGSAVWTLTGFHALHMVTIVLKTIVIVILAVRGYFTPERNISLQVNGLYWHFVAVVWIPIYVVVYLSPRFLG